MQVFMSSSKYERPKVCTAPDCDRKPFGHGLCTKHYKRARRHGLLPKRELITAGEKIRRCTSVNPVTGCWEWQRKLDRLGYARSVIRGAATTLAHRIAYVEFVGPIPEGLDVCHRCDNRKCCNPSHLFLATHQENMADRDAKGRGKMPAQIKGSKNPRCILTPEQVRIIRASTESRARLARRLNINQWTIRGVSDGKTYTDVV